MNDIDIKTRIENIMSEIEMCRLEIFQYNEYKERLEQELKILQEKLKVSGK
jgi:polyhydroxyalkanoate synthesis regulator phasin